MYDYTWLTELMASFGEKYPAYFDATLGADLRTCALVFWAIVLWGVTHPYRKERRKEI